MAAWGDWRRESVRLALLALVLGVACGLSWCTNWQHVRSSEDWSLYVKPGDRVNVESFEMLLDPAVAAVEAELGPFQKSVRVHAWNGGVDLSSGTRGVIGSGADAGLVNSDLGVARVRAFHVKQDPFGPGGIFLGEPSPGSAVHEMVHARLAELDGMPLWFEEGLAMLLGDGELVWPDNGEPYWVRDGMCAWPRSVLRRERPSAETVHAILELDSKTEHTIDENLLVNFLGWALVFDLYRQDPDGHWEDWLRAFQLDPSTAMERIDRSLDRGTLLVWLNDGLAAADAGVLRATARGTWRGASSSSLQLLSSALRHESDPDVRATLAINLLAAAGEGRYAGMGRWNGLRLPLNVLETLEFGTAADRDAAQRLIQGFKGRGTGNSIEAAFRDLEAYWQE